MIISDFECSISDLFGGDYGAIFVYLCDR